MYIQYRKMLYLPCLGTIIPNLPFTRKEPSDTKREGERKTSSVLMIESIESRIFSTDLLSQMH